MSKENDQTIEVYKNHADRYLLNAVEHNAEDIVHAQIKQDKLHRFINEWVSDIPRQSAVFEIGSGDGETASFLQSTGFNVLASDVADGFLEAIRKKGLKAIHFNVLKDRFPDKYHVIICWRVFVHFTTDDARTMLNKAYDALEVGGRLIFNAMNYRVHSVEEEWLDFDGAYHMGQVRYYHYFSKEELQEIVISAGYNILHVHYEGGATGDKWLVFVIEK